MRQFLQGTDISLDVVLEDYQGEPLTDVSKIEWSVIDENEALVTSGVITEVTSVEMTIVIPSKFNLVTTGEISCVRLLTARVSAKDGNHSFKEYFLINSEYILKVGENSCMSYMHALKLTPRLANLQNWSLATEDMRKTALLNAYINISRLSLYEGAAGKCVWNDFGQAPTSIRDLDATGWANADERFKQDFCIAQLVEADHLLGGDSVEQLRSKGVMSYTVGEVKQFFRTTSPLDLGVSSAALRFIGRYIHYNRRIGRA